MQTSSRPIRPLVDVGLQLRDSWKLWLVVVLFAVLATFSMALPNEGGLTAAPCQDPIAACAGP